MSLSQSGLYETEALGVRLLDPITFQKDSFVLQGKYLCGRAIDDRFGCAVLLKLAETLAKKSLDRKITFVWSVQEEIGLHGATVIGNRFTPDIVIADCVLIIRIMLKYFIVFYCFITMNQTIFIRNPDIACQGAG